MLDSQAAVIGFDFHGDILFAMEDPATLLGCSDVRMVNSRLAEAAHRANHDDMPAPSASPPESLRPARSCQIDANRRNGK
jgi:hypothetical protein